MNFRKAYPPEHERQNYKGSAEETKENNRKYIEELAKENKELKKFREDIVANKKAAYASGINKIPTATYFEASAQVT